MIDFMFKTYQEHLWISYKKTPKKRKQLKKKFTKLHKTRASFSLNLFIYIDPEDTDNVLIGKTVSNNGN